MKENVHYMWFSGNQTPDFRTINNFRSQHLKGAIKQLFTQVVLMLAELGYIITFTPGNVVFDEKGYVF